MSGWNLVEMGALRCQKIANAKPPLACCSQGDGTVRAPYTYQTREQVWIACNSLFQPARGPDLFDDSKKRFGISINGIQYYYRHNNSIVSSSNREIIYYNTSYYYYQKIILYSIISSPATASKSIMKKHSIQINCLLTKPIAAYMRNTCFDSSHGLNQALGQLEWLLIGTKSSFHPMSKALCI